MGERRMKITALYDGDGHILAAVVDNGEYDIPRPVAGEGQKSGTFEVPQSAETLSLEQICTTFRVDPTSNRLTTG
jgi:hypothetical protein